MSRLGSKQRCDICGSTPKVIYDAPTAGGRWGWMCPTCWVKHRVTPRLGTGMGQKFENINNGKKLEG